MFAKRFALLIAGFVGFVAVCGLVIGTSENDLTGIPRRMLPTYKAKLAELEDQWAIADAAGRERNPLAVCDRPEFDFGLVDPHTTLTHTFLIRNDGDDVMTLDVADTTCKCTVASTTTAGVLPGGAGQVTLIWNTGYKSDTYDQTARVVTNDPRHRTIDLHIHGTVRADFVTPKKLTFDRFDVGQTGEVRFLVYSQRYDDFVVESIDSDLPGFGWDATPVDPDDPRLGDADARWAWEIAATTTGARRGAFTGELDLTMRSPETGESIHRTIPATGRLNPRIGFESPDLHRSRGLDIGTLTNDTEHRFGVTVRNRDVDPHRFVVAGVEPAGLTAVIHETKNPNVHRLEVIVPAGMKDATFNRGDHHGFVHIVDPDDESFHNWFPVWGAVTSAVE